MAMIGSIAIAITSLVTISYYSYSSSQDNLFRFALLSFAAMEACVHNSVSSSSSSSSSSSRSSNSGGGGGGGSSNRNTIPSLL